MEDEIILTTHAVEEYINDNPFSLKPEKDLKVFYHKCKKKVKFKQAKRWINFESWTTIIRFDNQAVVFNENVVITYYRIISKRIEKYQTKIKNKFKKILNWKLLKQQYKKELRKIERHRKKYWWMTSKNNTYKYNNALSKCFNNR